MQAYYTREVAKSSKQQLWGLTIAMLIVHIYYDNVRCYMWMRHEVVYYRTRDSLFSLSVSFFLTLPECIQVLCKGGIFGSVL